jgi:hypothetical protein
MAEWLMWLALAVRAAIVLVLRALRWRPGKKR